MKSRRTVAPDNIFGQEVAHMLAVAQARSRNKQWNILAEAAEVINKLWETIINELGDENLDAATLKHKVSNEKREVASELRKPLWNLRWDADFSAQSAKPHHARIYRCLEKFRMTPTEFQALRVLNDIRNQKFHPTTPQMGTALA